MDRIRFSQSFRAAFGFLCVSLCLGARNRRLRRQHPCSRFDPYFPKNTQKGSYFPKVSADPPPPRGGPLLKHPTFARASLGNEALWVTAAVGTAAVVGLAGTKPGRVF